MPAVSTSHQAGFAVFSARLGIEAGVLRAVSALWVSDPSKPPITLAEFALRLADAQRLAVQQNPVFSTWADCSAASAC